MHKGNGWKNSFQNSTKKYNPAYLSGSYMLAFDKKAELHRTRRLIRSTNGTIPFECLN